MAVPTTLLFPLERFHQLGIDVRVALLGRHHRKLLAQGAYGWRAKDEPSSNGYFRRTDEISPDRVEGNVVRVKGKGGRTGRGDEREVQRFPVKESPGRFHRRVVADRGGFRQEWSRIAAAGRKERGGRMGECGVGSPSWLSRGMLCREGYGSEQAAVGPAWEGSRRTCHSPVDAQPAAAWTRAALNEDRPSMIWERDKHVSKRKKCFGAGRGRSRGSQELETAPGKETCVGGAHAAPASALSTQR